MIEFNRSDNVQIIVTYGDGEADIGSLEGAFYSLLEEKQQVPQHARPFKLSMFPGSQLGLGTQEAEIVTAWKSRGGLWQTALSQYRLIVNFDAAIDTIEGRPTTDVVGWVSDGLADALPLLQRPLHRLALVRTATAEDVPPNAMAHVARVVGFDNSVSATVEGGGIPDFSGRVNRTDSWPLPLGRDVLVNRLLLGKVDLMFREQTTASVLTWQYDINTSPTYRTDIDFDSNSVREFLRRAATEIDNQLSKVLGE